MDIELLLDRKEGTFSVTGASPRLYARNEKTAFVVHGFEQGELDLAHSFLDVSLGQLALVPEFPEGGVHFINE